MHHNSEDSNIRQCGETKKKASDFNIRHQVFRLKLPLFSLHLKCNRILQPTQLKKDQSLRCNTTEIMSYITTSRFTSFYIRKNKKNLFHLCFFCLFPWVKLGTFCNCEVFTYRVKAPVPLPPLCASAPSWLCLFIWRELNNVGPTCRWLASYCPAGLPLKQL